MADLVGWRIVKEKHARTAFSGEGARLFGGRWNSEGVPMVYCSESLALAALETLVHAQTVVLSGNFRAYRVAWPERMMTTLDLRKLPKGWNTNPPTARSQSIGDEWARSQRSAVLSAPSVIVLLERTFLLNPLHPDFGKIKIKDVGPFVLDQRLR